MEAPVVGMRYLDKQEQQAGNEGGETLLYPILMLLAPLVHSVRISGTSAGGDIVPQGLKCDHVTTDFPFVS